MKTKKIIIILLFVIYIAFSYVANSNVSMFKYSEFAKLNLYDYTNRFNASTICDIKNVNYYDRRYSNIFREFDVYYYNENKIICYVTNLTDVDKLIEDEKITNTSNIDFKKHKFNLPIDKEEYQNFFGDDFTKVKQEAKVIGKDANGYSKFDISPDALILLTEDNNIISYAYIDNRLIDTRDIMNKKYKYYTSSERYSDIDIKIDYDKNGTYNKYKLVEVKLEKEYKDEDN
ncbi:hypothetical protein HMPREF1143_1777 [Peptoanaerobacter stomatis]|uniref:Uncharacterized protein n=1 Tax=Peptoanaerobacter stomatis TaxID=796937 RepID=J5WKG4_9FIRM|nr:hypothetical protein [Peptoanaerobacter stomatis]EJU22607.1 hypothetical protein HMPREF1143_1777 [Peptoanaerobacter stomatis]NWO25435.1 hypothetical protein [Peptostreptococcaceae bacterium oral taxon 081]